MLLRAYDLFFRHDSADPGRSFCLEVPSLEINAGEFLAICGPSGSGKSTLLAILAGLLRPERGEVIVTTGGARIDFFGDSKSTWRSHRRRFGFVHQDPRESLNERRKVVDIVADPLRIHSLANRRSAEALAIETLRKVGLSPAFAGRRPGELSGGQRQRVALARAIITRPAIVFLDEPTSALDVSVQASIVALLQSLKTLERGTTFLLVTHDLPLARQLADRVMILEGGKVAEIGDVDHVFQNPASSIAREMLDLARGVSPSSSAIIPVNQAGPPSS